MTLGRSPPGCCRTTAAAPITTFASRCGSSPTMTRSTWSSWAAARAARSWRSGWPGGLAVEALERRAVLGPETDWVSDEAGSHSPVLDRSAGDRRFEPRCRSGSNNSGRGVGDSMVHYALHPAVPPGRLLSTRLDGVRADWPVSYAELRPYYEAIEQELPVWPAEARWPSGKAHGYPRGVARWRNGRSSCAAQQLGIHGQVGPVRDRQRPVSQPPHCVPRDAYLPAGLQG